MVYVCGLGVGRGLVGLGVAVGVGVGVGAHPLRNMKIEIRAHTMRFIESRLLHSYAADPRNLEAKSAAADFRPAGLVCYAGPALVLVHRRCALACSSGRRACLCCHETNTTSNAVLHSTWSALAQTECVVLPAGLRRLPGTYWSRCPFQSRLHPYHAANPASFRATPSG